ncbi:MAG: TIGR03915 family putative DNA repair protein [Desulfotomaculum sp.]|nr:TIGR03915 family putative DNA repair protein [Desulfotomaculum sp.]
MLYYIYDGSFQGLLTAVYEAYYRREEPFDITPENNFSGDLFARQVHIKTDGDKAGRVFRAVKEKISPRAIKQVYYVFLSEIMQRETLIYCYLKKGFKLGKDVDLYLTDKTVHEIQKVSQKVGREKHRMLGLIRFRKLVGDIYYAPIEPDYNIVTLVAPHFARRLSDQNWVIHDTRRGSAVLYNKKEWVLAQLDPGREFRLSEEEKDYQQMWRGYFNSASVPGRTNTRLQRQFMPVRYWKYLIEKQEL